MIDFVLSGQYELLYTCPLRYAHGTLLRFPIIATATPDPQIPTEPREEAVNAAIYLHQRVPDEGLRREQRQYSTSYKMLYVHGKPFSDIDGNKILYKAPLHHISWFGRYASRQIPRISTDRQQNGRPVETRLHVTPPAEEHTRSLEDDRHVASALRSLLETTLHTSHNLYSDTTSSPLLKQ